MTMREASAFAPVNIALAKYWGKRDARLNLPTNGSISVTLDGLGSETRVKFDETLSEDVLILNGEEIRSSESLRKISIVLDELRSIASARASARACPARVPSARACPARVSSRNNFPTAAGLASSASGLAALTLAASRALDLDLSSTKLSEIARRGSGSACRSFFGGFVEWKRGELADGADSVATQLQPASHWDLRALIAVIDDAPKDASSTGGMTATQATSPYFRTWVESAQTSLGPIRNAIAARDFAALAAAAEENCLRMHACAMAASPPIVYWKPQTLAIQRLVREMRANGIDAFFTIDAGPNVVVISTAAHAAEIRARLAASGVTRLLEAKLGEGTRSS